MNDRPFRRVQHLEDVFCIGPRIEEIADVELLQVLVTIKLLIIGVSDSIELRLIMRGQDGLRITPEIRTGHRNNMRLIASDGLAEMVAKLILVVGRNVMKLVHCDQPVVELLSPELIDGEPKSGMGAYQHLVVAFQE